MPYAKLEDRRAYHRRSFGGFGTAERRQIFNRWWGLKSKYGMTPDDWDRILEQQDGKCAVCQTPEYFMIVRNQHGEYKRTAFVVDHTGTRGKDDFRLRGILCNDCNRMLGLASERVEVLEAAVKYLRQAEEK